MFCKGSTSLVPSPIVLHVTAKVYRAGILDCARQVLQTEGAKGLFVGFTPALIRSVFANAAAFALFEYTKTTLMRQ